MIFRQIDAGGDRNFAYLMGDAEGGEAAIFDPPPDTARYLPLLDKHRLTLAYVIVTHGHGDHTWGVAAAKRMAGARIVAHPRCPIAADIRPGDGDTLALGSLTLAFLHTPGHTADSMCIRGGDKLVTGDTLFVGKVGGTNSGGEARAEYESLHGKLMTLDDAVEVFPGHNYGVRPSSTIGAERRTNPFLLRDSFDSFLDLKIHWLDYKREHGIL